MDTLELNPGDCVDLDVRVVNTGNEGLQDVRLYHTFPGNEDWTHDIPEIGPGQEIVSTFQYCVPEDATAPISGYVWFEELDKQYDPPPAESNLLNIDITRSLLNVDAKANGKDEIFVGIGWDVTFSVEFDPTNCTNPRYFWDLGDAKGLFNDAGGTYSYDKGGTYKAKVRVTCDEGWEEDIVDVHVVDVEILVNDTLDDPDIDGDDGELDDVVRLKTELPPGHPEGLTARVFTTPCSVRLKQPLSKDAYILLMSPDARVGFADAGAENPQAESMRELILHKNGDPTAFAITGQTGSEEIQDATIRALLDEPGPPVFEEDVTVYWYDSAKIDIEVLGTYGFAQAKDDKGNIIPNLHYLQCVPSDDPSVPTTAFPDRAVFMKGKAWIRPDGSCLGSKEIEQTRIAIVQNCRDWEVVIEYHDPLVLWDPYGPQSVESIEVSNSIRVTTRWPDAYVGQWILDAGTGDRPLYDRNFEISNPSNCLVIRPPAPCPFSNFSFTHGGEIYMDHGTWYNDAPSSPVNYLWPGSSKTAIPIYEDGSVVARVQYARRGKVTLKELFRTWVVTYWRELPYEEDDVLNHGPEEIIPLKETEWWLDIDTSVLSMPILEKHQAQAWDSDIDPLHFPVITGPAANEFQFDAADPALRPHRTTEYFNGTTTVHR